MADIFIAIRKPNSGWKKTMDTKILVCFDSKSGNWKRFLEHRGFDSTHLASRQMDAVEEEQNRANYRMFSHGYTSWEALLIDELQIVPENTEWIEKIKQLQIKYPLQMAKATLTPVASTELVTITSAETAKVVIGELLIKQMEQACDICESIEIVDDASLQVGRQQLTALNKTVKAIEDQRKKVKEPYLKAGKMIDEAANLLTERAEQVIKDGKKKMLDYEAIAKAKADELIIQAQLDAEKIAKAAAEKAEEANRIANMISEYETKATSAFTAATSIAELKAAHEKFIKPGFPPVEYWEGHSESAKEMLIRITAFKDVRKAALLQQQELEKQGGELSALEKKKLALKAEMQKIEAEEAAEKARKEKEAEIAEQRRKELEMAKAQEQHTVSQVNAEVSNTRGKITFELVNWENVIDEWKQLNEDKVKEFIKEHKKVIANGSIVNGIMFKIERNVVLS